ncbi:MAG: CDP-alcohol phosphatidyltransferase family protein [Phycisphaerae bacterium]|nr:CDP-alcohol phosphatidyltransferase family protein [Phycisphaerae bacterium]
MIKQLPNILTLGRLVLSVVFLAMVYFSPSRTEPKWLYLDTAFVIFLIAAFTDLADGHIARKFNATSKFGRIVDPLADKVLICGAFIVFALIGEPKLFSFIPGTLTIIQWTFAGVIVAREAMVTVLRHWSEAKGIKFPATMSGKVKMLCQAFAVGTVMVKMSHVQTAMWGYWFTAITYLITITITIISGILSLKKLKTS